MKFRIGVVIITKNRRRQLMCLLDSITQQTICPEEIIIIDDITDGPSTCQKDLEQIFPSSHVSYVQVRFNSYALSRNMGFFLTKSKILLSIDDDVVIPCDYIEKILDLHKKNPSALGFVGKVLPLENNYITQFQSMLFMEKFRFEKVIVPVDSYPFSTISLRVDRVKDSDIRFNSVLYTGEDHNFLLQLHEKGEQLFFSPDLVSYHRFRRQLFNLCKRAFQHGRSLPFLVENHSSFSIFNKYIPKNKISIFLLPLHGCRFAWTKLVRRSLPLLFFPINVLYSICLLIGVYSTSSFWYGALIRSLFFSKEKNVSKQFSLSCDLDQEMFDFIRLCYQNSYVSLQTTGISMFPTIKSGQTVIVQVPKKTVKKYKRGDIVAFFDSVSKKVIAHRIIKVIKNSHEFQYQTRGDNKIIKEIHQVRQKNILGRIIQ